MDGRFFYKADSIMMCECQCACHNNPDINHPIACCVICPWCGRRIRIEYQAIHNRDCLQNPNNIGNE